MERKIKILLSKLGLDVHNRGIITVAKYLKDAGMEVIYIGNALPKDIIGTAIQEAVDVVGVSSLGGAHQTLGSILIDEAKNEGMWEKTVFLIGGVFPPRDIEGLKKTGFDWVFTPGATRDEIVSIVEKLVSLKRKRANKV